MTPRSDVIVPLYVYPAPGAWEPLHEVIKAHPSVTFTVVVNPGNGPGPESVPDACYTAEIPRLTAYPNVRLVGYVHASYTRRDLGLVLRDVTKYSGWAERSGIPGLAVQGIFVDETPNQYDEKAAQYLTELTNAVKESAGLSPTNTVIHNPGCVPDNAYLTSADATVVFEDTSYTFQLRHGAKLLDGLGDRGKIACVMHSLPEGMDEREFRKVARQVREVAGMVFMTDLAMNYYAHFSRSMWSRFVAAMDGADDEMSCSSSMDESFDPREHKPKRRRRERKCLGGCIVQ